MGKELEFKLAVPDERTLEAIMNDAEVQRLSDGAWQTFSMKTTYFDTAARAFSRSRWTLRQRMENGTGVVCLKTPTGEAHTRGEWQVEANAVDPDAVERLLRAGAPGQLLALYGDGALEAVCGAEFRRRCVLLHLPDGSVAELAGDVGFLTGKTERQPFAELELELKSGAPDETAALAAALCARYGLHEQRASKHARALRLK